MSRNLGTKTPGTLSATPGLLRDSFTFTFTFTRGLRDEGSRNKEEDMKKKKQKDA
jgi:hypothetical protein